jgi:hypothetical protein
MAAKNRRKRPEPSRKGPRRNAMAGLGGDETGAWSQQSPGDAIANAVNLGYRVVEEYLEQGRDAAQRFRKGSYSSANVEEDLKTLVDRLVRVTKDITAAWTEILSAFTRAASPAASRVGPAVSVELKSKRRTEVMFDLRPLAGRFVPSVPALYAASTSKSTLTDIQFRLSADGAHAVLAIDVPDDLPPGVYSGAIVDSTTNVPGGTLSVRIYTNG